MHLLLVVGMTLLTAGTPSAARQPELGAAPLTVTFVSPSVDAAIAAMAQMSGVTIEIDASVTDQLRREAVHDSPVTLRAVTLEQALDWLTTKKGLSYSVVDSRTVRIFKKA